MSDVRIVSTTPIEEDFRSFDNSPIVIDDSTDIAYYYNGTDVTPLQATAGKRYITTTATLDFPSVAANGVEVLPVTLTGVTANCDILLGPQTNISAGFTWCAYVVSNDTVQVRTHNNNVGIC